MTETRAASPADTPVEAPVEVAWHAEAAAVVLAHLGSTRLGLDAPERASRLVEHGPNTIGEHAAPEPWWRELAGSFTEPLPLLLIAVAVLSAVFGEVPDAIAIAAVIVVVAVVETVTELRAARAINALRTLTAATARVITPRGIMEVPAAGLVPGDVLALDAGDVVPADARVLSARGLRADESTLTGESAPVGKAEAATAADTELAERSNLLYAGTAVVAGEGRAVVVATGAASELGRLGRLVTDSAEPPTGLQVALGQLARAVLVLAVASSVAVVVLGIATGQPWREMLLAGLTVAFATVPEELPILVVVLLAVGGRQLARQGALLRRLRAGETLGAVTTVVTDKTGTLTENQLRLVEIVGSRDTVLGVALHCQDPDGPAREPMEIELAAAARRGGVVRRGEQVAVFPFDPARKLVSRAWRSGDKVRLAVSGAPEAVLARCRLDEHTRGEVDDQITVAARRGLRIIAFATRELPADPPAVAAASREDLETDLIYQGLVVFVDPLRPGVPEAVATLTAAGVATIMITGDHPVTAAAVAAQTGLPTGALLHGGDLSDRTDAELDAELGHGTVIARATPATKHRVVALLQRRGEVVAVTGDGVNDAPALAAADVGIAMGRRGADLARAAADVVLTDDAYPTVVTAIAKGRNISAQLRRAVAFYLGAKLALVAVVLAALATGRPVPFEPVHIVLLEIFMDLGASVAFVAEPAAPAAMRRPPRPPGTRFLDHTTLRAIVLVAAALTAITLPTYLITAADTTDVDVARAATVLAWLAGHALIAWTLRAQPALAWTANPAFPIWAATATVAGVLVACTPIGALVELGGLPVAALGPIALLVLATSAATAVLTRVLRLRTQL